MAKSLNWGKFREDIETHLRTEWFGALELSIMVQCRCASRLGIMERSLLQIANRASGPTLSVDRDAVYESLRLLSKGPRPHIVFWADLETIWWVEMADEQQETAASRQAEWWEHRRSEVRRLRLPIARAFAERYEQARSLDPRLAKAGPTSCDPTRSEGSTEPAAAEVAGRSALGRSGVGQGDLFAHTTDGAPRDGARTNGHTTATSRDDAPHSGHTTADRDDARTNGHTTATSRDGALTNGHTTSERGTRTRDDAQCSESQNRSETAASSQRVRSLEDRSQKPESRRRKTSKKNGAGGNAMAEAVTAEFNAKRKALGLSPLDPKAPGNIDAIEGLHRALKRRKREDRGLQGWQERISRLALAVEREPDFWERHLTPKYLGQVRLKAWDKWEDDSQVPPEPRGRRGAGNRHGPSDFSASEGRKRIGSLEPGGAQR